MFVGKRGVFVKRGVWKKEERRASVGGLELCLGMKGEEEEDLFA